MKRTKQSRMSAIAHKQKGTVPKGMTPKGAKGMGARAPKLEPATAKPSKRELEIHRFLKKRRYQEKREEYDKRFPFTPDPHPDVQDYSKDVKRIRKALELDDVCFFPGSEMFGMIDIMMLCAGHSLSDGMPADTKFLYAIQRP